MRHRPGAGARVAEYPDGWVCGCDPERTDGRRLEQTGNSWSRRSRPGGIITGTASPDRDGETWNRPKAEELTETASLARNSPQKPGDRTDGRNTHPQRERPGKALRSPKTAEGRTKHQQHRNSPEKASEDGRTASPDDDGSTDGEQPGTAGEGRSSPAFSLLSKSMFSNNKKEEGKSCTKFDVKRNCIKSVDKRKRISIITLYLI